MPKCQRTVDQFVGAGHLIGHKQPDAVGLHPHRIFRGDFAAVHREPVLVLYVMDFRRPEPAVMGTIGRKFARIDDP